MSCPPSGAGQAAGGIGYWEILTSSKGILEDLLKAEELEDGQVDGGVQTQAALVGAQGRVELDPVAAVDLDVALVILPLHAELDDALGDGGDLEGGAVLWVLLEQSAVLQGRGELVVGLLELGLGGEVRHDGRCVYVCAFRGQAYVCSRAGGGGITASTRMISRGKGLQGIAEARAGLCLMFTEEDRSRESKGGWRELEKETRQAVLLYTEGAPHSTGQIWQCMS